MPLSLLELEERFAQLKRAFSENASSDSKLLALSALFNELKYFSNQIQYSSFFSEFDSLLSEVSVDAQTFSDCSLSELQALRNFFEDAGNDTSVRLVLLAKARKLLFAGDVESAVSICAEIAKEKVNSEALAAELGRVSLIPELTLLETAIDCLRDSSPGTTAMLAEIQRDWKKQSGLLSRNQACCLLVEMSFMFSDPRGRLRILQGTVEQFERPSNENRRPADELTFNNQLRGSDDPIVGVVYSSLAAVRLLLESEGRGQKLAKSGMRSRFEITGIDGALTGTSIGLAAGIVAFSSLLRRETLRHERFISGEACFAGALEVNGAVVPVNDNTLKAKLERAFFSHLRSIVLSSAQVVAAVSVVKELQEKYPRRNLRFIGVDSLRDVVDDLNIVRAEKVWLGQFVARKVAEYSRGAKVQVPILLALLYILISIVYPKAWIGFDWNPEYLTVNSAHNGIEILNADSALLWSVDYECESIDPKSAWKIGDIDDDGKNEVAFSPKSLYGAYCSIATNLYVHDNNGDLLFRRNCSIQGQYPGDTLIQRDRGVGQIIFVNTGVRTNILTNIALCFPSRTHIRLWSATGDSLGWYVNAGAIKVADRRFAYIGGLGYVFVGINNRKGAACMFVLPESEFYGVSPPYSDPDYDLSGVIRGNQTSYVIFPPSDVNKTLHLLYNQSALLEIEPNSFIKVSTAETEDNALPRSLIYRMDQNLRVFTVRASDNFITLRENLFPSRILSSAGWTDYLANMRDSVQYFTKSGWVTEGQLRAAEAKNAATFDQ